MYTALSVVLIDWPDGLPDEMLDPLRFTDRVGGGGRLAVFVRLQFVGGVRQCESKATEEPWENRATVQWTDYLAAASLNMQILHTHWNNSKTVKFWQFCCRFT